MEDELIKEIKSLINDDKLTEIKELYYEYCRDEKLNWAYIYQKVYLHACLKKKTEIVEYLKTLFQYLTPVQQVSIRQMFHYGDYLLRRVKSGV